MSLAGAREKPLGFLESSTLRELSVIFTTCSNSCGLYLLRLTFPSESLI